MFRTFVLLVALFALGAVAMPQATIVNGSIPIGDLAANKWNQTSFTFNPEIAGVAISSIWFYFADINTAKPIPVTSFQRGSITLSTSNQSLSVYNALTDSLNAPRVFPANYPLIIPKGTLTLKASWALNVGQATVSGTLSWAITLTNPASLYALHANMMVQSWSSTGLYSSSVTAALPYDGILVWAIGNVLSGGTSVVIQNNSTGSTICTSAVGPSGDMSPCTPNANIPQGTKITVTVHANGTFEPNAGGADLYFVKVPPPPTTTTTTHATSATHATTATHSTSGGPATSGTHGTSGGPSGPATSGSHGTSGGPSGPATSGAHGPSGPATSGSHGTSGGPSGPSNSGSSSGQPTGSGTSTGGSSQSTGAGSTTTSSVSMGYSSGSSGSGGTGGGNGFLADVDSIFVQKFEKSKKSKIVINDAREPQQILDIAEIDELPSADPDHFRVTEEKASQKFL
jgi:hypothetical protein